MVDWTTIGASVTLSVIGSIISSLLVTEYQLRRERTVEADIELEEWYTDSAAYAAEVRRTWQRLFDGPESPGGNLSELQGELDLLEGQISRHASAGEQLGADQEVITALDDLAEACRRPVEQTIHVNAETDFVEFREEVLDAVEDVEQAIKER